MNFLPLNEKRIVRMEYYKRLAVAGLILLAVLIAIAMIPVAVSDITSGYEIAALSTELSIESAASASSTIAANLAVIKGVNGKLDILNGNYRQGLGYDISEIFSAVALVNRPGIRLTSFAYDKVPIKNGDLKTVGQRFIVGGTARDRSSLNSFVKVLGSDSRFSSVDLPVSDLISSKDINFFITIMLGGK